MLKPKRVELYRPVWQKIKDNGYDVIPLAEGKAHPFKGWPELPNGPEDIARWSGRAAAVRMFGSNLLVIDADTRMPIARDAVLGVIEDGWPEFYRKCLWRHSGGVKVALIGRTKTDRRTMQSRSWYPEPGVIDKDRKNQVEVFTGNSRKYVGVHGMHSEGREYGYDGPSITDVREDELPWFPGDELSGMVDACDAAMERCGLHASRADAARGGSDTVVYDLLPEMVFRLKDGTELTLAALEREVEQYGRQEGYGTVFDPKADTADRVKANMSPTGLALWDTKTETSHRWAARKPVEPAVFAAELKAVAELHGVAPAPDVPNWRERYAGGGPKASLHNARLAIGALGFICSLDVFHNKMLLGSTHAPLPPCCGEVTDAGVMALRVTLSDAFGLDFTEKHVRDAVVALAGECRFNPVTDMLAEAEANWDGVARLDRMAVEHFNAADTRVNAQCVAKTLIAAVARARRPGCKFDNITVLEAPEGWNKSSAWLVLAGAENFSDESIIGKASREVQEQLAGVWIHENAELAGMRKAEVETVKAFASRQVDRARPAYGHFLVEQARHSIEVGTTNGIEYLQSQTGNRRFWPIKVEAPIDLQRLRSVRLQLWGEAAARQSAGEALTLDPELWPAVGIEQEERRVRDAWEDLLEAGLKVVTTNTGPLAGVARVVGVVQVADGELRVSVKAIFDTIIGLPAHALDDRHTKRLANCMRALGWTRGQFRIGGEKARGYSRKVSGS